jgi:hypothetical protein
MASTYSTNLAIELIGTGDQAGAWGNTTNTNLGTLIEQAISGYVTQAVATGTDTTITIPNGSSGVARNMYIELTGTGGTNTNLIVPANKKLYFIYNNTSSGQVTVKVSGQTGVSVPNGEKVLLVSNGTDVVNAVTYIADLGSNSLSVTNLGAVSAIITTLTAGSVSTTTLTATSANITNLTATTLTLTNALRIAEGGTGLDTTPTNGQLLIGNGTGFALSTLTAGPGIGVTNSAGSITLTATGTGFITSVNATSPLQSTGTDSITISIASSTGTGAVVLSSGAQFSATSANITTLTSTSANLTTLSSTSANVTTLTGTSATITNILDGAGNVRKIPSAGSEKTSVYTLSVSDIGEFVTIGTGGGIDVPNNVFSAGDAISIFNNTSGTRTISLTITTAYISGTDSDKASVSILTRGLATVLFINPSLCVVSGNVV